MIREKDIPDKSTEGFSEDRSKIHLKRVLGPGTVILLIMGTMLGTGVFKKIVPMAQTGLNEWYILGAWVAGGFIAMLGAFNIAGLSKLTTNTGGKYEYMRIAFGDFLSFMLGWTGFTIISSGSVAALAFIFAQSIDSLVTLPTPFYPLHDLSIAHFIYPFNHTGIKILAIAAIVVLTWFNYLGIKMGAKLNNAVTWLKVLGILALVVLGLFFAGQGSGNISSPPVGHPLEGAALFSAFFTAILASFWAYVGSEDFAFITGEIKNPRRNIPIAITTAVGLIILIYLITNYAYMNAMPLQQLADVKVTSIAATAMASSILGETGTRFVSILIALSSFGALNLVIIFYPRLYYKMAQEKMFFRHAANVHPIHRTPYVALVYSMVWSCILVISGTFEMLTNMVVFTLFITYALLAIGLIKMKMQKVITDHVAGYPWVPILFILISIVLLVNTFISKTRLSITGLALVASGLPFYFYFKWRKNKEELNN